MTRRLFVFDLPDRFATGTVGEPGNRSFFLQARDGGRVVSVALEKAQVAVLAERLGRLLVELDRRGIVEDPPTPILPDERPLDEPLNEAFRATTLTLGWDGDAERILIEARAPGPDDEEEAEAEDAGRGRGRRRGRAGPPARAAHRRRGPDRSSSARSG